MEHNIPLPHQTCKVRPQCKETRYITTRPSITTQYFRVPVPKNANKRSYTIEQKQPSQAYNPPSGIKTPPRPSSPEVPPR